MTFVFCCLFCAYARSVSTSICRIACRTRPPSLRIPYSGSAACTDLSWHICLLLRLVRDIFTLKQDKVLRGKASHPSSHPFQRQVRLDPHALALLFLPILDLTALLINPFRLHQKSGVLPRISFSVANPRIRLLLSGMGMVTRFICLVCLYQPAVDG